LCVQVGVQIGVFIGVHGHPKGCASTLPYMTTAHRHNGAGISHHEVFMTNVCRVSKRALPWLLLLPGAWAQTPFASGSSYPAPAAREATLGAGGMPEVLSRLDYVSVLGQYQAYAEQAVTSWPQANATVQRIGGWRVYAKEAAAPPPLTPPARGVQP